MVLLALDTSTNIAGVALYGDDGLLAEYSWHSHRDQTAQLLPTVARLLDQQRLTTEQLTGVAVALGPGSFNGLRVAVSTAKGLCAALGIPLYGVPTLDGVAQQHAYLNGTLCAIIEAGRGRVGAALYTVHGGVWRRTGEVQNTTIDELAASVEMPAYFAGEMTAVMAARLVELHPGVRGAIPLSPAASLRRAGFLAEVAARRAATDPQGDDLATLEPLYLHQPPPV